MGKLWGKTLVGIGFTMSARFPGLYFHERLEVALVTDVEDLLCSGSEENLNWVRAELLKYEVKGQVMAEGNTEVKFLGRTIGRNERGFYWEEHPRVGDEVRMERVTRYLRAHPRCRLSCVYQEMPKQATVLSERQRLGRRSGHPTKHQRSDDLSWCSSFAVRKPFAEDGGPQLWRSRT